MSTMTERTTLGEAVSVEYPTVKVQFLEIHLQLLKTLYKYQDDDPTTIHWDLVEQFLQHRSTLLQAKGRATQSKRIYQSAVTFQQQQQQPTTKEPHIQTLRTPSPHTARGSPLVRPSLSQTNHTTSNNNNSFHLIARLLEWQHDTALDTFESQIAAYRPLLQDTHTRIANLTSQLITLQQVQGEQRDAHLHRLVSGVHDQTIAAEEHASSASSQHETLLAKRRLWQLLVQDLQLAVLL